MQWLEVAQLNLTEFVHNWVQDYVLPNSQLRHVNLSHPWTIGFIRERECVLLLTSDLTLSESPSQLSHSPLRHHHHSTDIQKMSVRIPSLDLIGRFCLLVNFTLVCIIFKNMLKVTSDTSWSNPVYPQTIKDKLHYVHELYRFILTHYHAYMECM